MGRHRSRGRPHHGRHRLDRVGGIRCHEIEMVGLFLRGRRRLARRMQRHSWAFLTRNGGSPRPAFALILSL